MSKATMNTAPLIRFATDVVEPGVAATLIDDVMLEYAMKHLEDQVGGDTVSNNLWLMKELRDSFRAMSGNS